jgi:hypothetical protein
LAYFFRFLSVPFSASGSLTLSLPLLHLFWRWKSRSGVGDGGLNLPQQFFGGCVWRVVSHVLPLVRNK